MAWSSAFVQKLRNYWVRKIVLSQYYMSTNNTWYNGVITEKYVDGGTITFKIETTDEESGTITKIRLFDADGSVAYEGTRNIVKDSSRGALIQIDVPLNEE